MNISKTILMDFNGSRHAFAVERRSHEDKVKGSGLTVWIMISAILELV
jgi:hypothetical protein